MGVKCWRDLFTIRVNGKSSPHNMSDFVIEKVDTVNVVLDVNGTSQKNSPTFLRSKFPVIKFMPAYKNKVWDGTIKLYNMFSQTIYYGLLDYVYKFAEDRKYTIDVPDPQDFTTENHTTDEWVEKFINDRLQPVASGQK